MHTTFRCECRRVCSSVDPDRGPEAMTNGCVSRATNQSHGTKAWHALVIALIGDIMRPVNYQTTAGIVKSSTK